jgi:hypothetical protein
MAHCFIFGTKAGFALFSPRSQIKREREMMHSESLKTKVVSSSIPRAKRAKIGKKSGQWEDGGTA